MISTAPVRVGRARSACGVLRSGAVATLIAWLLGSFLPAAALAAAGSQQPHDVVFPESARSSTKSSHEVTAHFVSDLAHASVLELDGSYDRELDGAFNSEAREAVAQEYLRTHADEYDFLVVFTGFDFSRGGDGVLAFYLGVRNDVFGIATPIFDESAAFGSDGKLQGYVDMGPLSSWEARPTDPRFERTLSVLVHELFHRWAARVRARTAEDPASPLLLGQGGDHWSFLLDTDASVLYGNDWQSNGDGTFTSAAALRFLSPLDLYLAGFYGADEVPPFTLLDSPGVDRERLSQVGVTLPGLARQLAIDDVVAVEGARMPAAADAQHRFRVGFLYLGRPGEPVGEEVPVALDALREGLMTRFAILTGGRGALEIYPEAPTDTGTGEEPPVDGGPLRPDPAVVADALAWLRARQQPDLSWQDRPGTQLRDTATVSIALLALDPTFGAAAAGPRGWLSGRQEATTDSLARQVSAIRILGEQPVTAQARMLAQQNADGGWGLAAGYGSDPLDTALALLALAPAGPSPAATAAGTYLLGSRGADGGWSNHPGAASRASVTGQVLRALAAVGREATVADGVAAWLATKQNLDGGFGDSPSTAHDTANVLLALMETGRAGAVDHDGAGRFLRNRQTVEGSWEGSVYTTATVVSSLQRLAFPNWQLLSVTADPAQPFEGQSVGLRARVRSTSNVPTPSGLLRLYRADGGGAPQPIGEVAIPALESLATAELVVPWDTTGAPGLHHLIVRADPDAATAELSETDNEAALDVTVIASPPGIDLTASALDVAVSPPQPSELPTDLGISAVVRNLGQTAAPSTRVMLWKGAPGSGTVAGETTVAVAAQSSVAVSFVYTLAMPGATAFTLEIDPDGAVAEDDETNNRASFTVTPAASVDLEVTASDLALLGTARVGADATFRVRFRNRGTVASPTFAARYEVRDGAGTIPVRTDSLFLDGGQVEERTVVWRVDREGSLALVVTLDPAASVPEAHEDNNAAELPFPSSTAGDPNLTVDYHDVTFTPDPALEGAPLEVGAVVRNVGGGAAGPFAVAFFEGDPAHGGVALGAPQTVSGLAAGANVPVAVTVPSLAGPADRLIFVVADAAAEVTELEKNDNSTFVSLTVTSLPDLAVSAASLSLAPSQPVGGQPLTLLATVANLGEQPATSVLVRAFDGDPSAGGTQVGGDQTVGPIAGGSTGTASFTWAFAAAPDPRQLVVVVDPVGAIAEGREDNNRAALPITSQQQGDLFASEPYISPDGDGVKDETTLAFDLDGEAVALELVGEREEVLRRFELASPAARGELVWDGRDDRGRVVADGTYAVRALDAAGDVLARAAVVVDTNRSSLLLALDTPFLEVKNLTCHVPDVASEPRANDGEQWLTFVVEDGLRFDAATMTIDGGGFHPLSDVHPDSNAVLSPDGSRLGYDQSNGSLWAANADGSDPRELLDWTGQFEFTSDGRELVSVSDLGIDAVPLSGGARRALFHDPGDDIGSFPWEVRFSPDRSHVVFPTWDDDATRLWLLDLGTGAASELAQTTDYLGWDDGFGNPYVGWSPDGSRFAHADRPGQRVRAYGSAGALLGTFAIPLQPAASIPAYADLGLPTRTPTIEFISSPVWSDDGDELAFEVEFAEGQVRYAALFRADLTSGALAPAAWLDANGPGPLVGLVRVEERQGEGWVELGSVEARDGWVDVAGLVGAETTALRLSPAAGGPAVELERGHVGFRALPRGLTTRPRRESATRGRRLARSSLRRQGPVRIPVGVLLGQPVLLRTAVAPATRPEAVSGVTAAAGLLPHASHPGTPIAWVPFDRALVYSGAGGAGQWVIDLDRDNAITPLLPEYELAFPVYYGKSVSPSRQRLFFEGLPRDAAAAQAACVEPGRLDFHSVRSLLNLTTDLRVLHSDNGQTLELRGTAADANFSHYQLEWTLASQPTAWRPMAPPSNRMALDELLGSWFPPGPGSCLVRLTVFDLAGNRRSVQRAAAFAEGPSITDVSLSPSLFSPNGDGVLDETVLRYRVLAPVRLQVDVLREGGSLVRTYQREHADVGSTQALAWDGRDGAGRLVDDGKYVIRLLGAELPVEVDTKPPSLVLGFASAKEINGGFISPTLRPKVSWSVSDKNLSLGSLLGGVGASPASWLFVSSWPVGLLLPEPLAERLELDEYVGRSFRSEASDLAGNRAARNSPLGLEEVIVTSFGDDGGPLQPVPVEQTAPFRPTSDRLRFRFGETVRSPLVELWVQYHELRGDGVPVPWSEARVANVFSPGSQSPAAAIPDGYLEATWDLTTVGLAGHTQVRFRAVDADGQLHYSDLLGVFYESVTLRGFLAGARENESAGLVELAQEAGLAPEPFGVIFGEETVEAPFADISLYVTSDTDSRYATPRRLRAVAARGRYFVFDSSDLRACTTYRGRVVATTEPQRDPSTGLVVPRQYTSPPQLAQPTALVVPCLTLEVLPSPVSAEQCGGDPPGRIRFDLEPLSLDGTPLHLLTLSRVRPDGTSELLFSRNGPRSGERYTYELDTAGLPVGPITVRAELVDAADAKVKRLVSVPIDRQSPQVALTYPVAGQRLCRGHGVDVLGSIDDGAGAGYRVRDLAHPEVPFALTPPGVTHFAGKVHELGEADTQLEGDISLRLEAIDWDGFHECADTTFYVDGAARATLAATPLVISPNGDGALDEAQVEVAGEEPLTVSVSVSSHGDGAQVASLLDHAALIDTLDVVWNGQDDDHATVPDGVYDVRGTATDECGNERSLFKQVEVDTTPPLVALDAAALAAPHPLALDVVGAVADLHLESWQLEVGAGANPQTWQVLASSTVPQDDAVLATWNTYGLVGTFTLRLSATDRAGLASELLAQVELDQHFSLLGALSATPRLFSPNADGRRDATALRFTTLADAELDLVLRDGGGAVVRTLATARPYAAGAQVISWDGARDGGLPAADGDYVAVLSAHPTGGSGATESAAVTVTLDRTPPAVSLVRPQVDGAVRPADGIFGSIVDAHLASWTLELAPDAPPPTFVELARGVEPVSDAQLATLLGWPDGDYQLRLRALDEAESETLVLFPFALDSVPPAVTLTAPADGAVVGDARGPVLARGTIEEEHLREWRLELRPVSSPDGWGTVGTGSGVGAGGALEVPWSQGALPDGDYRLRLLAVDLAGQTSSADRAVTLDGVSPLTAITHPAAGAFVRGATAILGRATDAHLDHYELAIAPAAGGGGGQWSPIGTGTNEVPAGGVLLDWSALPPDGTYLLRLQVVDTVGNAAIATVPIGVDQHPPQAPVGLTAHLEGARTAVLVWTANAEADLAGYAVHRDGVRVNASLLASPAFSDPDLTEGRHRYTVTAFDEAGNESEPSGAAEVTVDLTPPTAALFAPVAESRVSGLVEIRGTASSGDDFGEYRLSVAPGDGTGGGWQLLRRSHQPASAALLAEWSSIGATEGALFTFRLEAEDLTGNVAEARVAVTVDNLAPAAPTGLVAVLAAAANVDLSWAPNAEADLLGYLLYRGGRLANATGPVVGSLAPYLLTATSYHDLAVPDGTHDYTVQAMDRAGNLSPASATARVTLDNRRPHALIVDPADGARFESALYVAATSVDLDVQQVELAWRPVGGTWAALGAPDTSMPYEGLFDPASFDPALPYGDYELRAVASDAGGADPSPISVRVTYGDITAPAAPADLTLHVDGGDAHLGWPASTATDIASYRVTRRDAAGVETPLTPSPPTALAFVDAGLADGGYTWSVVAIDHEDNASSPSPERQGLVYAATLEQPFTPVLEATTALAGTGAAGATAGGEVTTSGGPSALPPASTDDEGGFAYASLPLAVGENRFTVRVTDGDGDLSKPASVRVVRGNLPEPPAGLGSSVADHDATITWQPSVTPGVLGYLPYDGDEPLLLPAQVTPLFATASRDDAWAPASAAVDGDPATWWGNPDEGSRGDWLEVQLGGPRLVTGVWAGGLLVEEGAELQGWDGEAWVTLETVLTPPYPLDVEVTLPRSYRTDRVRLLILGNAAWIGVSEVEVFAQPLVTGTDFTATLAADGVHPITVTSWSGLGFESAPSAVRNVGIGDATPPSAPTLAATVDGSLVHLTWSASPEGDLARYDVYRDNARIAEHTDLGTRAHDDLRPNGTYRYFVTAVDAVGNASERSNEVEVTVAVAAIAPPQGLAVTAPASGGALDLAWQPGAGGVPVAYRVARGTTAGGPYAEIAVVTTASYRDETVGNGTRYYYVVRAVDSAGNVSDPSAEASGVPADHQPPPAPTITFPFPVEPGGEVTAEAPQLAMSGLARPGAEVALSRDARWSGATVARATAEWGEERGAGFYRNLPALSPDGRTLLVPLEAALQLQDVATGEVIPIATDVWGPYWTRDGARVIYMRMGVLYSYDVAGAVSRELLRSDWIGGGVELQTGGLLVVAVHGGVYALWRVDPVTDTWESMLPLPAGAGIDPGDLQVASTGRHVAYHRWTPVDSIEVLDLVTKAVVVVGNQPAPGQLSWSPDGQSLLYGLIGGTGRVDTWRYDAGGTPQQVTEGPTHRFTPQWSPDGLSFASIDPDRLVYLQDLASGALTEVAITSGDRLQWSRSGRLAVIHSSWASQGLVRLLLPPGWFGFDPVELAAGLNRFTATASDDLGNTSGPSNEVRVLLPDTTLPDLTVEDLRIVPSAPEVGQPTTVSVTVRNQGAAVPASELSVAAQGPLGSVLVAHRDAVGPLPPGGAATLSWTYRPQLGAGRYVLVATADPAELVSERDETDNEARRELRVVEAAGPVLEVTTDQPAYGSHQELHAAVEVFNAGPSYDGRLEWAVEDVDGFVVETLPPGTVDDLAFDATQPFAATWDTGDTYAGLYRVRARLLDAAGAVRAEGTAPFGIAGFAQVDAQVAAERGAYAVGSTVRSGCDLSYLAGNRALAGLAAALRVLGPGGDEVDRSDQTLGTLLPGDVAALHAAWTSTGTLGTYRVQCQLRDGAETLAGAESSFELLAAPPAVVGTLTPSSRAPAAGTPLVAGWRVTNAGAAALTALPVTVRLLRAGSAETLDAQTAEVDLAPGASANRSPSFATAELGLGSFLLVLEARLPGSTQAQRLQVVSIATVDHEAPAVALLAPGDGDVVGAGARLLARAQDHLSSVRDVALAIDGGGWQAAALGDASEATYVRTAPALAEGTHTLAALAVDAWDNAAETATTSFVVDATAPEIEIAGVAEGGTYGDDVTVTFAVHDAHPGSQLATLDDAPVGSGVVVSALGAHTLVVAAADAAGNTALRTVHFTLVGTPLLVVTKEAELAVDADGDGVPSPGDELEYELVVRNAGGGTASGVVLEDPIPAHTTLVAGSVTTTRGTVTTLSPVHVDLGALEGGAVATVHLRVLIDDPVPAAVRQIDNQALVTSVQLPAVLSDDPLLPGAADPTVTVIVAAPVLVASKTAALAQDHDGDGVPSPGDALEYTLSILDLGNTPATGVRLTDPIPAHATVVAGSVTTSHGSVVTESPLDVAVGELPPGETAVVRFRVAVELPLASGVTSLTNQGVVTSAELPAQMTDDPAVGGAADPTVTPLTAAPVLVLTKRDVLAVDIVGDGEPSPGDELLYQLALANNGNTTATEVRLEDAVPLGTSLVGGSVQTSQGTVTSGAASPVRVDLGAVEAGAGASVSFRVTLDSPFPQGQASVSNQATLSSHELPSLASDDPDTATLGDPTATPVSSPPSASVADASVSEQAGAGAGLPFVVTLSRPAVAPVTLHYATLDGTALAGQDYTGKSGDLTIAAGESEGTVRVLLLDDTTVEAVETFGLRLSAPVGATLGDADATGSILDDDGFGVGFRDGFELGNLSAWSGGRTPADAPPDEAGAASASPGGADGRDTAILGDAGAAALPAGANGSVRLSVAAAAAAEEGEAARFLVTLDRPAERAVAVDYETADGTATAGEDYRASRGRLVIPARTRGAEIVVELLEDDLLEPSSERFEVLLSHAVGGELQTAAAEASVLDDELCAGPNLLGSGVGAGGGTAPARPDAWRTVRGSWRSRGGGASLSPSAGRVGCTPCTILACVTPDAAGTELAQEVDLGAFGTAIEGGQQAFAFEGFVRTREAGAARVVVEYLDESDAVLEEYDSSVRETTSWLELEDVRTAPSATRRLRVRLIAAPAPRGAEVCFDAVSVRPLRVPVATLEDAFATEGAAGSETTATFRVALSCPFYRDVGLAYATADVAGRAGEDYRAASGTVTVPVGSRSTSVSVPILGDDRDEGHETFRLEGHEIGESGAAMLRTSAIGVIANDDFCPRGPEQWATDARGWPLDRLTLGARDYGASEIAELLGARAADAATELARRLAATKLDLAAGSDPSIATVTAQADASLAAHPPGSEPQGGARERAEALATRLEEYYEGGCGAWSGGGGGDGH